MADAISVGNGKYLYTVNDSIQGMGGKPWAHKPGKRLKCQTSDLTLLLRNNGCLCNFQAVKVYRTFCYLDLTTANIYYLGQCGKGETHPLPAYTWKWCGWYLYVGCQGYPGGGGWTDPLIGNALDNAAELMQILCAPQYIGDKKYKHSVQQRLVTNYQCCTTDGGLQGCCKLIDSDSLGQKKCVTSWTISRESPDSVWGLWVFLKVIGCVGQNAYLANKQALTPKIDILGCNSARGYAITSCGTCLSLLLYKQFTPNSKPTFKCKYWVLYGASYVLTQEYCGWGDWALWDWSSQPLPDQSIVKGTNGWAPYLLGINKLADGRKANVNLYLCKTRRVWRWKAFDTLQEKDSFDPTSIKKADDNKCRPCTLAKFLPDHKLHTPKDRLNKGQDGAPCVLPLLPRSVIGLDRSCYDIYLYLLSVLDATDPETGVRLDCIKKLSYKTDAQTQKKKYRLLGQSKTLWLMLNLLYDGVRVMDNLGRTIKKDNGSWYFLRVIPCGEDPDEWDLDGGASKLPLDKLKIDVCDRAFLVGVYCVSDSSSPIIYNGQVVGYNKKPYVTSGVCGKWLKIGTYTLQQIALSATDKATYKYDLTKKNQWQKPRWRDQGDKFDLVYIKTSNTRDVICDKYPEPPNSVYYRAKVLLLLLKCSDSSNNWDGIAKVKWPLEALCISDATQYCQSATPVNMAVYKDKQLKQPVLLRDNLYILNGCKAYMCILLTAQDTPYSLLSTCTKDYLKTEDIELLADKVVFDNCVTYKKYSLWQTSDPCKCAEAQEDDLGPLQQDEDCNIWSIFPKLNSSEQITVCSCDLQWALLLIKRWLRLYTLGELLSLDLVITLLLSKLELNTPIPIKNKDGIFTVFYVQSTDILKPLLWDDQEDIPLTLLLIAYQYMHDPCQFAVGLAIPAVLLNGVYACTLMRLVPLCHVQSDSKLPDYGGVHIATKYDDKSDYCLEGTYKWCTLKPPADQNYYLDRECTTLCPYSALSLLLVLLPPSDARLIWYLSNTATLMYILGDLTPEVTCLSVTLGDRRVVLSVAIMWGGNNQQALQDDLNCCPRYLFKYLYVVIAAPNPCLTAGTDATILLAKDLTKSGWLSYLPVTNEENTRQWKDFDPARQLIIGLPTCDPLCSQLSRCLWDHLTCSGGSVLKLVFSISLVLSTPTIAADKMPALLFPQAGVPDMSGYYIKLTGHLSYIPGLGAVFLWDVENASIACAQSSSEWDNTACVATGHLFTYYANSPLVYGKCSLVGSATHTSPRNMNWDPAIAHPLIPKAKWTMTRTYRLRYTRYSDAWCSLLDVVAYCGQDLCDWNGEACATTWRLAYTQALDLANPPLDSPLACWNRNPPQVSLCITWKYTRKFQPIECASLPGKYTIGWLNSSLLDKNWENALLVQTYNQWISINCSTACVYIKTSDTKPTVAPLQLGMAMPSSIKPSYLYTKILKQWQYSAENGLTSASETTVGLACSNGGSSSSCGTTSSYSLAYTEFAENGTCTAPVMQPVPLPWALYSRTWTYNAETVSCTQSDLQYTGLVCSRKENPTTCSSASGLLIRYAYTRSAKDLTTLSNDMGVPVARYFIYRYQANTSGTKNNDGDYVFSDTNVQGTFYKIRCLGLAFPENSGCYTYRLYACGQQPTAVNNLLLLRSVLKYVKYTGTYCIRKCAGSGSWSDLTYTAYCTGKAGRDTSSTDSCCQIETKYLSATAQAPIPPANSDRINMRFSPSVAVNIKKYWYATYIWDPSSVSLTSLVRTCLNSASTFSATLQRDTSIAPAFDLDCNGGITVGSIRGSSSTIQVCTRKSVQIYFTSTNCSTTSATPPATRTVTITKSSIKYKLIIYENGCQTSSGTYTYSGSSCINSSKIGIWSKLDSSVADINATWRYYYGCTAPTTDPPVSLPGGNPPSFSATIWSCTYPYNGVSYDIDLNVSGFLSGSQQKVYIKGVGRHPVSLYFTSGPPLWGATTCIFNLKFIGADDSILGTISGSYATDWETYTDELFDYSYSYYAWNLKSFNISSAKCGMLKKVTGTLTFSTTGTCPNWDSYRVYCNYGLGLYVRVYNASRSATSLTAYSNAEAALNI